MGTDEKNSCGPAPLPIFLDVGFVDVSFSDAVLRLARDSLDLSVCLPIVPRLIVCGFVSFSHRFDTQGGDCSG